MQTIITKRCGEQNAQRYTLVMLHTENVYDSGRQAWGVKFQSDSSRRLQSDEVVWFEVSEQQRDEFVNSLLQK